MPTTQDPDQARRQIYDFSMKIIGALAPHRGQGVKELLDEIEDEWGYYPWDIATASATIRALHGGPRRKEDRERITAMLKRREKMLKAVGRLRKAYTAGGDPLSVIVVDGPRLRYEELTTGGRPAAFYRDRYVALIVAILAEARWPDSPPEGADPRRQAITMAAELLQKLGILPRAGGRQAERQRDTLGRAWRRLCERGEPPPPRPDDADPLGWASDVWWWLQEGATARDRVALPPPLSPVVDMLVAAGGKLQYARVALDPQSVEHLRRALPSPDLEIYVAQAGLLEIITKRGIPQRLERAARGELPTGAPPDPGPADDTRPVATPPAGQ